MNEPSTFDNDPFAVRPESERTVEYQTVASDPIPESAANYAPAGAYGPAGGYAPYGPYGVQPDFSKLNTYSILALVFAFVFAPVGIVFGALARGLSKVPGAPPWMKTVGSVGFWLSLVFTALPFLIIIPFLVASLVSSGRSANHGIVCVTDPAGNITCEGGNFWNRGFGGAVRVPDAVPIVTPPVTNS